MKLLALSALLCALMALALAADDAEPEPQPEPESEPESEPEEAKAENAAVEKRFFCLLKHFFHKHKRPRPRPPCRPRPPTQWRPRPRPPYRPRPRPPCRPRPRWTKIGCRYFRYIRCRLTWHQAERKCVSLGGHLASVHSAWEHRQIRNLIRRQSGHHSQAWIGGTDQTCEGHWKWTDGSRFNYKGWCCGEPNNLGNEDCLQINFSSHKCWNDLQCHNKLPSVCVRNRRR